MLRGIQRDLADLAAPKDDIFARMRARLQSDLQADAAERIEAAARAMLARRRASLLRDAARAVAPAPLPREWSCPLRLCQRRGCRCDKRGPGLSGRK